MAEKGPQAKRIWGGAVPQIMPNINGRLLRIHGFTPAELMMGYNPEWTVFEQTPAANPSETVEANEALEATQEVLQHWVEKRLERRERSMIALINQ